MTDKPENPYAFPMSEGERHYQEYGMTLRDWFAGQALAGMLAYQGSYGTGNDPCNNAARAYEHADTMLAEREKEKP